MSDPTLFSVTTMDDKGVKATSLLAVDYDAATMNVSGLIANAMEFGSLINAIVDGIIIDVRIQIPILPDTGWKTANSRTRPVAGCDVEKTGLFNFDQAGTKYAQSIDVPSISQSVMAGGRISLTDTGVAAFIERLTNQTALTGGLLHDGACFANSLYHNALTGLRDVQDTFRKHRKSLKKKTLEGPG